MKIILLTVGQTDSSELRTLIDEFGNRINRYIPFEIECIPNVKTYSVKEIAELKIRESQQILKRLLPQDAVWILDEKGKTFDSRGLATQLQKTMNAGPKRIVFIIGGAFGFDPSVTQKANDTLSLSKLTFNHQIVRLMAVEQIYRAFSILKGDPYHND